MARSFGLIAAVALAVAMFTAIPTLPWSLAQLVHALWPWRSALAERLELWAWTQWELAVAGRIVPPESLPEVRVGVLQALFSEVGEPYSWAGPSMLTPIVMAFEEINNKSDGIADEILPGTKLKFALRDSKCSDKHGPRGAFQLMYEAFNNDGVDVLLGPSCSSASTASQQVASLSHMPQVSPTASSPALSDQELYLDV